MRYLKLGISNITPSKLVSKAQYILFKMTDNPNFPNPTPSLVDFETALNELKSTIQLADDGWKQAIALRYDKVEHLKVLIRQLAAYVTLIANGDGSTLMSSGFDLQRERQKMAEVSRPVKFSAVRDQHAGSVKLSWKAVKGARMYTVEITTDEPADENCKWQVALITAQSRTIIEDLTLGEYYWFRVKAFGRKGESPWSDVRLIMAA